MRTKTAVLVEENVGVGTDLQLEGEGSKNKTKSLQTRELPLFSWMLFVSVVEVTGYYVYPHCYVRVKHHAFQYQEKFVLLHLLQGHGWDKSCLAGPCCTIPAFLGSPSSGDCWPPCQLAAHPSTAMSWYPLSSRVPSCWETAGKKGGLASMLLVILKQIQLNWLNCCSQGIAPCFAFVWRLLWFWRHQSGAWFGLTWLMSKLMCGPGCLVARLQRCWMTPCKAPEHSTSLKGTALPQPLQCAWAYWTNCAI